MTVRDESVKVKKGDLYRYAEIGDIDVDTGGVAFHASKGFQLPTDRPQRVKNKDVLISTVRTYRKGIGMVTDHGPDLVASQAILALSGVTDYAEGLSLPYIFAFLRTDFFVEQVWSLLNRGVYPRMDTGALGRISIPISNDPSVCSFIAALAEAIAEKERAIRARNDLLLALISSELAAEQVISEFAYSYPRLSEIRNRTRFDAAIYSREYKSKIWQVTNYAKGYRTPTEAGFVIKPGPSLEIKILRTRIDSETPKPGFYTLLIPANISEYGTMSKITWLGTAKKLPLLKRGDILFGEAGFRKGRSIVLIDEPQNTTTNAHGLYARRNDDDIAESIFFRCIFHWYRNMRLIDLMAVGGSGGHFSPEYFDNLLIPNFPTELKERIVKLYHSPTEELCAPPSLAEFVDYHRRRNDGLGIWQLEAEMRRLEAELSLVLEDVIQGKSVRLPWNG
ncbi:hypothetical protein DU475_20240 [Rhodopseudomonas sp. WA056]|nr:hypothetical protein [Rhodopseudomonas sp. WA056]